MNSTSRFTHIVVGGGTAGCLLANRLSQDSSRKVLLLEGGGTDASWWRNPWFHVPIGYLYCIGNPRADWMYTTQPCSGLQGRSIRYPRGKVLGGCSAINGMLYLRGQSRDFDHWAEVTGDPRWAWASALRLFKQHERHHLGASEMHGGSGELHVSAQRLRWELLDRFMHACTEAGIPKTVDFNTGNNEGVGYFEVNQHNGWRWSSRSAFLPNNLVSARRDHLLIETHVVVDRLILSRNGCSDSHSGTVTSGTAAGDTDTAASLSSSPEARCVAVEGVRSGSQEKVQWRLDESDPRSCVILAAGAFGSPAILNRSGIGDESTLKRLGFTRPEAAVGSSSSKGGAVLCRPGVGKNLQDHLQLRTVFEVRGVPSLNTMSRNPVSVVRMGLDYALHHSGPLSMAPSQLGAFTSTDRFFSANRTETSRGGGGRVGANSKFPNVEFHVQPLSLDAFGSPLHSFDAITVSICNLNPTSRGTVEVHTLDPLAAPVLNLNYLSTAEDRQVAAASIRLARHVANETSFGRTVVREHFPGTTPNTATGGLVASQSAPTDDELADAAGRIATTIFHASGTCKMGPSSDSEAVVDSELRVHGVAGLRVADASVMPSITSGNTNAPTLVIAEHAAELLMGTVRRARKGVSDVA